MPKIEVLMPGASLPTGPEEDWQYDVLRSESVPVSAQTWSVLQLPFSSLSSLRIASLRDDRLRLIQPIEVAVRHEAEGCVVSSAVFNEYGYGRDVFEAADDLRDTLCELFWFLSGSEGRLSPDLARTLDKLREYVRVAE